MAQLLARVGLIHPESLSSLSGRTHGIHIESRAELGITRDKGNAICCLPVWWLIPTCQHHETAAGFTVPTTAAAGSGHRRRSANASDIRPSSHVAPKHSRSGTRGYDRARHLSCATVKDGAESVGQTRAFASECRGRSRCWNRGGDGPVAGSAGCGRLPYQAFVLPSTRD